MIEELNLMGGRIDHNDFDFDIKLPLSQQQDLLKEDLLQISYSNDRYIIDVGWYPDSNLDGSFIIYVIENYNWDTPMFRVKCKNFKELKDSLQTLINKIYILTHE